MLYSLQGLIQGGSKGSGPPLLCLINFFLQRFFNSLSCTQCLSNAIYTSKTVQNKILDVIKELLQETITGHIKQGSFSIIAGELTDDIANQHKLSLCVRYPVYSGEEIKITEGLLDFTYISRGTARHLGRDNQTTT